MNNISLHKTDIYILIIARYTLWCMQRENLYYEWMLCYGIELYIYYIYIYILVRPIITINKYIYMIWLVGHLCLCLVDIVI